MLYEDDVVGAVSAYPARNGYTIRQALTTVQRGQDIIADKIGDATWTVFVEAKGEESSRATSTRFGDQFDAGQVFGHVAKAVLKALRVASSAGDTGAVRAAIALPRNDAHLKEVRAVGAALRKSGVAVFWVDEARSVGVESPWEL